MVSRDALTHHTAVLEEVRLHYVISGDPEGEPVVLVHGWPQTWFEWRHVMPALAEQYFVIAPDMRGLGDSGRPYGGYDKKTVACDIRELAEQLGHESVRLVGHDLGAAVAYAYAAGHREGVSHLAILEQVLPGFGLEEQMDASISPPVPFHFHMVPNLPETLVAGRERQYLSYWFGLATYDRGAIGEEDLDEYARCYSAPGALRAGFDYYRALLKDAEDNRRSASEKLDMPVLALGGEAAQGELVVESARQVAENVEGGSVERCGHWMPEERPAHLAERLLGFLES